jgi:NO-binding membrane sensor protein with MHYT domain/nitrogen-specific signal transduction histidine kinase
MYRIYYCLAYEHDWRLVILAGLICGIATFTAFSLLSRAAVTRKEMQLGWLAATATVTGCGVWATHFVAMLAFEPSLPLGYNTPLTILSVIIAIVVTGVGFAAAMRAGADNPVGIVAGGVVVGMGVFGMHYTGMQAVEVQAALEYDPVLVAVSMAIGSTLAAVALLVAFHAPRGEGIKGRLEAAGLLTLGIVGLHFTAMGAITLTPDPQLVVPAQAMDGDWLAVGVALTTLIILAAGLGGSIIDQRFAERMSIEADRLHTTISELEKTKTDLEATAAQLESALGAAAAGSQAKSQFLAAMSHELRTPLNAVIGFSEALLSGHVGPLGAKQNEYIKDIHDAGTSLLGLVSNVLDFTKLEGSGGLQLVESEFDLSVPISEAVEFMAARARRAEVQIETNIERKLPRVYADALRIRQALVNLLSNAVKFTMPGGRVTISARRRDGGVAIIVADTGVGMSPNDIPKALELFGQIDSRLERRFEGTGIGLPLAKRLMEQHDGTLEIKCAEEVGTAVILMLPAARLREEVRKTA